MSYMIIVELHHDAPLRHQHCFRPATLLTVSAVSKIGVMSRWTQSQNTKLYNQILFNQELDTFWSSQTWIWNTTFKKLLKIRSKHPEVFFKNNFLKTFTKFKLFWKTSQNSPESICDEVFFEWYFEPSDLQLLYRGLYCWYFPVNLWNFLKQLQCVVSTWYIHLLGISPSNT